MQPIIYKPDTSPEAIAEGLAAGYIVPTAQRPLIPAQTPPEAATPPSAVVDDLESAVGDSGWAEGFDYTPRPVPVAKSRKYTAAERQQWRTPNTPDQPVLWAVAQVFGGVIGLDPTADEGCSVPACRHITAKDSCLGIGWSLPKAAPRTAFINPPFDKPHLYLEALTTNMLLGFVIEAIALLKIGCLSNQKTGTLIRAHASAVCCWGAGKARRMGFIDADGNQVLGADFDTCMVYFGDDPSEFLKVFDNYGLVAHVHSAPQIPPCVTPPASSG